MIVLNITFTFNKSNLGKTLPCPFLGEKKPRRTLAALRGSYPLLKLPIRSPCIYQVLRSAHTIIKAIKALIIFPFCRGGKCAFHGVAPKNIICYLIICFTVYSAPRSLSTTFLLYFIKKI